MWSQQFPKLGEKVNWFPGHMYRALRIMHENLKNVDMFIELRDSRVPISSRNTEFDELIIKNNKKKFIIFNKFDLCNQRVTQQLITAYNSAGIPCMAVSAKKGTHMKDVLKDLQIQFPQKYQTVGTWLMLCGMPNVGKSTIINQFRQISPQLHSKKALAKQAAQPCTTKNIQGIKILDDKQTKNKLFLLDSPGVMLPRIVDDETALKLSIIGCIKDVIPGKEPILEYLVWALNKQKVVKYTHYYKMDKPAENGRELFMHVRDKYRHFNYETTFDMILEHFREGKLGNITFDDLKDLEM